MADCMRAEFVRAVDSDGHGLAGVLVRPVRARISACAKSYRMVHISVKHDLLELDTSPLPETT
jgi:hypothetical protein